MNTSVNSKLVTLFDERGEEYMPQSKYKIKYIFNIVKGNCYKLKIKLIYGELIDMNIVLLFDKLVKITYNNNFIKIKTLCYNQFEEHTLLNYETMNKSIRNSGWETEWNDIITEWNHIHFQTVSRLLIVLEKIMDEELIEKVEEQTDLLDLDNEEKIEAVDEEDEDDIEEIVVGKNILKKVKILGKSYLKSDNDILYDSITEEIIGFWDPLTNNIIKANEDYDC